jgi:hypothetical protein
MHATRDGRLIVRDEVNLIDDAGTDGTGGNAWVITQTQRSGTNPGMRSGMAERRCRTASVCVLSTFPSW